MPAIVGKSTRVVDADGLTIDELAGNVASSSDRLSVALVSAAAGKRHHGLCFNDPPPASSMF